MFCTLAEKLMNHLQSRFCNDLFNIQCPTKHKSPPICCTDRNRDATLSANTCSNGSSKPGNDKLQWYWRWIKSASYVCVPIYVGYTCNKSKRRITLECVCLYAHIICSVSTYSTWPISHLPTEILEESILLTLQVNNCVQLLHPSSTLTLTIW